MLSNLLLVRVLPGITADILSAVGTFDEWRNGVRDYDYCAVLLHELVHALDYTTGKLPPAVDCVFGDGLQFAAREVKSMVAENAYRLSRGMQPREMYDNHRVPDSLRYPSPATWMRYRTADPSEICR